MKIFKKKEKQLTAKQAAIASLLEELKGYTHDEPEYITILKRIAKLEKIGEPAKDNSMTKKDWVTILVPAGLGLLQVYMIIRHEDVNVISTKAMGVISKPKI